MLQKSKSLILVSFPILFMIGIIPIIRNDYTLTAVYITITLMGQYFYREKNDLTIYISGFFFMFFSEMFFISTGVETFNRNSLFALMPIWLPFLWAYGFLVIKRAIHIIEGITLPMEQSSIPDSFYRVSVKALLLDSEGKFLLVRNERNLWDLPGGGMDFGENPEETLRREIREEMGLEIEYINPQPQYFYTAKGLDKRILCR